MISKKSKVDKIKSLYVSNRLGISLNNRGYLLLTSKNRKYSYPLLNNFLFNEKKSRLEYNKKFMDSFKKKKEKANEGLLLAKLREGFLGSQLGYMSKIEIIGIGYNVSLDKIEGKTTLVFKLGYSHLVRIKVPLDLLVSLQKGRKLKIEGVNYSKVFNFASTLQMLKLPSVYKKRGIYLESQKAIKLKAGKRS